MRYATHHLMVMHSHTKYNWPIWKDKKVMVRTCFAEKQKKRKWKKKIRLKQYVSLRSKGRHNYLWHIHSFCDILIIIYDTFTFCVWHTHNYLQHIHSFCDILIIIYDTFIFCVWHTHNYLWHIHSFCDILIITYDTLIIIYDAFIFCDILIITYDTFILLCHILIITNDAFIFCDILNYLWHIHF